MAGIAKADIAPWCPIPTHTALKKGAQTGRYSLTPIGLERMCSRCNELWPADTEFFYPAIGTPTGIHCWCKACYSEQKRHTQKPTTH